MKRTRKQRGNILLVTVCMVCFVILPMLLGASQIAVYFMDKTRAQSAVEAACLLAANDVSRMIIDDPHFGYVALSNYPPVGRATYAGDGEPLPVVGINTLVGTVRQNNIIAEELDNRYMRDLAEEDKEKLDNTIRTLNRSIKKCLAGKEDNSPGSKSLPDSFHDINGSAIDARKDVVELLSSSLPDGIKLESVTITAGWLKDGKDSCQDLPKPLSLARVHPEQMVKEKYRPFVDIPVGKNKYTFAGLSKNTSQVPIGSFQPGDDKHINSIIKVECTLALENLKWEMLPFGLDSMQRITVSACGQPYSLPDVGPKGVMTLRFTGGNVPGLQSWADFTNPGTFHLSNVTNYDIVGGDYPSDPEARLVRRDKNPDLSPDQEFSEHLYCWLRNGHTRPTIDAVKGMMQQQLRSASNEIYAYEFAPDGSISRRVIAKDPFPVGMTAESQYQSMVDTKIQSGLTPMIIFRNDVRQLGQQNGGKHAGQPLAGNPINWCEIAEYGGDESMAENLGKGRLGTKLTLFDTSREESDQETSNSPGYNLFRTFEGKEMTLQPRRSFYSGGLAVDIEIGGTKFQSAQEDIDKMLEEVEKTREI